MDIIPLPGLRNIGDIEALLCGDLSGILIDERIFSDERYINRLRFSVAHEIGHLILHKDIYLNISFNGWEGWKKWINEVPGKEWSFVESQAYEFAGRLLVPKNRLEAEFAQCIELLNENSKNNNQSTDKDIVLDYISNNISKIFGVSADVVQRRIQKEGLKIPD